MTGGIQPAPAVMARHFAQRPAGHEMAQVHSRVRSGFLIWLTAAFVASFGLFWAYVATMPMAFLSRDYPLWVAKRTMLDECRLGSVSVFGDSRTVAAVMPGAISVPVTNFAMSGTSPVETYFAVQRALRCPRPPKLVVIAHGALKYTADSDYWVFSAKTGFLSYAEMRAVESDAARLHDSGIEDLRREDNMAAPVRDALFAMRFPPFYFDSLLHGYVAARWRHNRNALRDTLLSSGHAFFGTSAGSDMLAAEAGISTYAASPVVDLYFSRTLALLAEHRVPVAILTMPINHATSARTPPELRARFAAYLRDKAAAYPGLRIVGPAIPCWPDRFFGDAWHFNAAGAEAYSRELGPWLSHTLAGEAPGELPDHCGAEGAGRRIIAAADHP